MKAGRSLTELAAELERQAKTKKDFVADTRQLEMVPVVGGRAMGVAPTTTLRVNGHGEFEPTRLCHDQIAARLGIPGKYYDRMQMEAPELLLRNVNHWLRQNPESRMIRTLDGKSRAFLSDRYRPLDNYDLAESVLPKITEAGCRVESAQLTDTRFYIKAVTERITFEVEKGDVVQAGIVISNSEVGLGAVKVEPLILRLVCLNGLIAAENGVRKFHIGRSGYGDADEANEFYRDETRAADDKAFWLKVRDTVDATLDQVKFQRIVERFRQAKGDSIEVSPIRAVEELTDTFALQEREKDSVLRHLIQGGDLSRYGMVNAITRASQDVEDYDRATDLERLGGEVLVLPARDWDRIAKEWGSKQR